MIRRRILCHSSRRGVALLMALVALVLLTSTAVPLLVVAHSASSARLDSSNALESRHMVEGLQPLLIDWARGHAAGANAPFFEEIYQERFGDSRVTIRAIDLSGRLHVSALGTFAAGAVPEPVRLALSADYDEKTARAEQQDKPRLRPFLDEFFDAGSRDALFPDSPSAESRSVSMAEWVTSHGEPSRRKPVSLNVNGAPVALLRAALSGRDPSDAASALALRQRGETIPDDLVARLGQSADRDSIKRASLRSTSEAFGFLINVENGRQSARYWLVAEPINGSWGCTLRRRVGT